MLVQPRPVSQKFCLERYYLQISHCQVVDFVFGRAVMHQPKPNGTLPFQSGRKLATGGDIEWCCNFINTLFSVFQAHYTHMWVTKFCGRLMINFAVDVSLSRRTCRHMRESGQPESGSTGRE